MELSINKIEDIKLQNYILNKIEQAYMLEKGLYKKEDLLGQPYYNYDYDALKSAIDSGDLSNGYYVLRELFGQSVCKYD